MATSTKSIDDTARLRRGPAPLIHVLLALLAAVAPGCKNRTAARGLEDKAFQECESALRGEADVFRSQDNRSEAEVQAGYFRILRTCAAVYAEPSCRTAWQTLPEHASQATRSQSLAAAVDWCRGAYCPLLAEPKPAGCEAGPSDWNTLRSAIFAHDLGQAKAGVLDGLFTEYARLVEVRARKLSAMRTARDASEPALSISITKEGLSLSTADGNVAPGCSGVGPGITIPSKTPPEIDREALAACARKLKDAGLGERTAVRISATNDTPYRLVVECMDAVRSDNRGELFPDVVLGLGSAP